MPLTLLIRPQELGPKGPPILSRQLQPTQLQPAFWIDFSNAATLFTDTARTTPVSADGDLIRGVLDQGARGLHLSTTTPPVYRVRAVNGLSVSRWDGVAKQLVSGPAILPQPFTRFAVVSCFDAGFNRIAVASGGGNDALGPYSFSGQWGMWAGAHTQAGTADTTLHIFTYVYNGASSSLRVQMTPVLTGSNPGANGITSYEVGSYNGGGQIWAGDICEVIDFQGLVTTADRDFWESYLLQKWFVPARPTGVVIPFGIGPRKGKFGPPILAQRLWDSPAVVAGNVTINVDVPGAVTWTGQTVGLVTTIAPTAGAITWTGQTVGLVTSLGITAGAVTWTGQALGLKTSVGITAGAITWTGQALGLKTSVGVTAGNITWQGQTITFGGVTTITVTVPGAITWAGQTLGLKTSIGVVAGNITWQGQTVFFGGVTVVSVTVPGQITWTGQTVSFITIGPLILSYDGTTAGGAPSGSVGYQTKAGPLTGGAASGSVLIETFRGPILLTGEFDDAFGGDFG